MVAQPVSKISKDLGLKMRSIIQESGNNLNSSLPLLELNNVSALSQYLNGTRGISVELLIKFCKAFNISPNELLGFDNMSNINNTITK